MALSDMQRFEEYAKDTANETVAQNIELFNGASQNTIVLRGGSSDGDFSNEAFWTEISGLVRRRDAYGSGAVSAVSLAQANKISVKVAGGTPPVEFERQQFAWMMLNPERAGVLFGEQLGVALMQDMLNSGLRAFIAATGNVGALAHTTAANMTRTDYVDGAMKMGDASDAIRLWVQPTKQLTDVYKENVTNSEQLFNIGNVSVKQDGFGRIILHTDCPDMIVAGSPNTYKTLGLTENAIVVEDNNTMHINEDTPNGTENIKTTLQAEFDYNLGLKGYAWDKASGGASPTDAELATGTNWDQVVTDIKGTAGVLITTQ